jgi:hypothetical protein
MALAVLLGKERPPAKREEIRRILQSNLGTAKIVETIKRLDEEVKDDLDLDEIDPDQDEQQGVLEGEPEASVENEHRRIARVPSPYRLGLPKLKSVLKLPRVRTSFFKYLFREFSRIAEFGRITHVFSPVFLLPILRLEPIVPKFYTESLTSWASELLSFLAPTLIVGWKHLPKKRYNMLAALDRLCREITSTNFRLLNMRDRNLIDKLRILETLFLTFHYRSENAEEAVEALGEAMTREPELGKRADRARLLANRILLPEFTIPSLYNLLLGLNMMKFRTAVAMKELTANDLGELFETEVHACDPEVGAKIQRLVEELKTKIVKLHREWSRLKRFKDLLKVSDRETPDFSDMIEVYEYTSPTLKPKSFAEDRENIMDFAPNFFRRFESCCSPLLNGTILLDGNRRIEIFTAHAFRNELDRLRLTASKLERSAFGFRSFPYERYLAIKREGKGGVSPELEVIAHLQEAATALVGIGMKIEKVLSARGKDSAGDASDAPSTARSAPAVDPAAVQAGRPVQLPYYSARVARGSWGAGRRVSEVVTAVASVCFQSAFYLYETTFVETIASERVLYRQMDNHLDTLRRIADQSSYDQLVGMLFEKK